MLIKLGEGLKLYFMRFLFKFYFCFVSLFILIPFIGALEIGMGPQYAVYEGGIGEEVCKEFEVSSDSSVSLSLESRWTDKAGSRELEDYGQNSFGINEEIGDLGLSGEGRSFRYCLSGEKAGKFYGVLLARADGTPAGVGSWIRFEVYGENKFGVGVNEAVSKLTGKITLENSSGVGGNALVLAFGISGFLFLVLLLLLLVLLGKKGANKPLYIL